MRGKLEIGNRYTVHSQWTVALSLSLLTDATMSYDMSLVVDLRRTFLDGYRVYLRIITGSTGKCRDLQSVQKITS